MSTQIINEMTQYMKIVNDAVQQDVGEPLETTTQEVNVDMPVYDYYRLGIALSNPDNLPEIQRDSTYSFIPYSTTELDILKKTLKKLGIKSSDK